MAESVRERVLKGVAAGDITRDRRGHQWWTSETEYRLLTPSERNHLKALEAANVIRFWTAGGYPAGTPIGSYEIRPGKPWKEARDA